MKIDPHCLPNYPLWRSAYLACCLYCMAADTNMSGKHWRRLAFTAQYWTSSSSDGRWTRFDGRTPSVGRCAHLYASLNVRLLIQ